MKSITLKPTSKKFFNKWLHKVVVAAPPAMGILISDMRNFKDFDFGESSWYSRQLGKTDAIKIYNIFSKYPKSEWTCRREGYTSVFTNNQDLIDEIQNNLSEFIVEVYSPTPETLDLLTNDAESTILVKKFPHNDFEYKVTISRRSLQKILRDKPEDAQWIFNNEQLFKVPNGGWAGRYHLTQHQTWVSNYLYVKDKNALLMLRLRNGIPISKIHKFVLA